MQNKLKAIHHSFLEHLKSVIENIDFDTINDILDNRDDDSEFDGLWMNAYNQISNIHIEEDVKAKIDEIRKDTFMLTMRKTGSHDLSAFISDDIELICLHYLNKTGNNWVAGLYATYVERIFPKGQEVLKTTAKKLEDLIG